MVDEIRNEEANPDPIPFEIPTDTAQTLVEQTTSQNPSPAMDLARNDENQEDKAEYEVEVEKCEEGNSRWEGEDGKGSDGAEEVEEEGQGNEEGEKKEEPVERNSTKKEKEVVALEEKGSSDDGKAVDEREARRNLRVARRNGEEEPEGTPEEATAIATVEKEAAERKRKGKQIVAPSRKRKPRQASRSVIIQEPL